jgi:pimeloyl-ACP methyl ester carboxylesterase
VSEEYYLQLFQLIPSCRFTSYRAGLTKHSLPVDKNEATAFSYSEKGSRNPEKPSIVFVHGLSSNKETWIPIVKVSYHQIISSYR